MTLSNAAEIVFLAATVPVLLRVNHERDGRTDGRTDSDDGNRGKATLGCVSPKNLALEMLTLDAENCFSDTGIESGASESVGLSAN